MVSSSGLTRQTEAVQTPATVFLDTNGISYETHPYEHDPAAESFGLEAAELLGLDPGVVFKTLMARLDDDRGELVVAIVPVTNKLDLKALARAAGSKRARMAAVADAERARYWRGALGSDPGNRRRCRSPGRLTSCRYENSSKVSQY